MSLCHNIENICQINVQNIQHHPPEKEFHGTNAHLFSGLASVSVHGGRVHGLEKTMIFWVGLVVSSQPKEHMQMAGVIDIKILHLIDIN